MSIDVQESVEHRAAAYTGSSIEQAQSSCRDPAPLTGDPGPNHALIDRSSAKRTIVAVVLLAGVLPALVSLAGHLLFGDAPRVQDPLHECLELVGSCVAIFVAMLLLLRLRHEKTSPHLLWVVAALVAMGLVDAVHGVHGITGSSWLRHGATLLGGTLFGLVWLPLPPALTRRKGLFVFVVAALVLAVAAGLWFRSEWLPMPWDPAGFYTLPVKAANGLGGLGFLAAALFFLRRYLNRPQTEDLVFGSLTLLFGTAALLFGFSHTWAADWWIWHGFRLLAYVVVLVAAYEMIVRLYEQSARDTQELERRAASLYARSLFEASLDPLVAISPEGKITDVNAATEEATGRDRRELVGADFTECFTEPEKARESYQNVLANGLTRDYPLTIRHASGHTTDVLYNASLFRDEAGAVQGVFAAARDVTERRRAERSMVELAAIVESSNDAIIGKDLDGTITSWNSGATRMFGYPADEMLGQSIQRLLPADREQEESHIQEQILRGDSVRHFDTVRAAKGGQLIDVSVTASPIRDASGTIVGTSKILRDTTERKKSEEALVKSEARYRTLVESLPQKICLKDRDSVWVSINENFARDLKIRPEEGVGKTEYDFFPRELADKHRADDARIMRTGITEDLDEEYVENGQRRFVHTVKTPVRDKQGSTTGILVIFWDITEKKLTEERLKTMANLERSNKELEQFAYVASHDLQEPLRMVSSYTQLLAERYRDKLDQDANDFIGFAVDGANRMQRLISDLLMYSRVGTRAKPLEAVDSHAAFGRAVANLRASINESGAMVTNDDLPAVLADEGQLVQLFQNLLGNGIKFQRQDLPPRIHVSAVMESGEWIFSVKDNGIGIPAEFRSRLFVIFQRFHKRDQYQGTGIGLAICKRIIERHGGRIWVESEEGSGSTFRFALPASPLKEAVDV
jgi:PAS domain S-box-containing protein